MHYYMIRLLLIIYKIQCRPHIIIRSKCHIRYIINKFKIRGKVNIDNPENLNNLNKITLRGAIYTNVSAKFHFLILVPFWGIIYWCEQALPSALVPVFSLKREKRPSELGKSRRGTFQKVKA